MMGLASFLNEAEEQVPWPAMEYVLGQINYGGHVTDDMDRRCLMSTLRRFITPRVMDKDYCFTPVSGTYYPPPAGTLEQCRQVLWTIDSSLKHLRWCIRVTQCIPNGLFT